MSFGAAYSFPLINLTQRPNRMLCFTKSIAKYYIFQWFCRHLPTCGELQMCGLRIQSRYFSRNGYYFTKPHHDPLVPQTHSQDHLIRECAITSFAWEYSDSSLQVFECIKAALFSPGPNGLPPNADQRTTQHNFSDSK